MWGKSAGPKQIGLEGKHHIIIVKKESCKHAGSKWSGQLRVATLCA